MGLSCENQGKRRSAVSKRSECPSLMRSLAINARFWDESGLYCDAIIVRL
jgi:hypothetical protein